MNSSTTKGRVYQVFCGLVMFLATAVSLLGTLPFLRHYDPAGQGPSIGDGLILLIWVFGLLGVALGFIAEAPAKRPMALIAFGWSIAALAWDAVFNACPANVACARDVSDHAVLLGACFVSGIALLIYDKYLPRLPVSGRTVTKGLGGILVMIWVAALLLAAILVNKPIAAARVVVLSENFTVQKVI